MCSGPHSQNVRDGWVCVLDRAIAHSAMTACSAHLLAFWAMRWGRDARCAMYERHRSMMKGLCLSFGSCASMPRCAFAYYADVSWAIGRASTLHTDMQALRRGHCLLSLLRTQEKTERQAEEMNMITARNPASGRHIPILPASIATPTQKSGNIRKTNSASLDGREVGGRVRLCGQWAALLTARG